MDSNKGRAILPFLGFLASSAHWCDLKILDRPGASLPSACSPLRGHLPHMETNKSPDQSWSRSPGHNKPILPRTTASTQLAEGELKPEPQVSTFSLLSNWICLCQFWCKVLQHIFAQFSELCPSKRQVPKQSQISNQIRWSCFESSIGQKKTGTN